MKRIIVTRAVVASACIATMMVFIGCPDNTTDTPGGGSTAQYICANGTPVTGTPAGSSDVEQCQSCTSGYTLSGNPGADGTTCLKDAVDNTAPTFTVQPAVKPGSIGATSVTVTLTASEVGKVFWALYADGTPAPGDAAALIHDATRDTPPSTVAARSAAAQVDTTTDAVEIALTGLTKSTTYNFYAVLQDSAGNTSDLSPTLEITTASTATYTCENGTAKGGTPTGGADIVACQSCNPGFKLTGAPGATTTACVATQYTCENGTAKGGTPGGTADIVACQSCSSGFKLTGNAGADTTACVDTQYTCPDGIAKTGSKPAGTADIVACQSCSTGFKLTGTPGENTTACVQDTADSTPPTFIAGPTLDTTTDTTATVKLTASEAGKLFWVLYADGTPAPATDAALISDATVDTRPNAVIARSATAGVAVTLAEVTLTLTELTPATSYDFYAVLQDSAGNTGKISSPLEIPTAASAPPQPDFTVIVTANPTATTFGESVALSARVTNTGIADAINTTLKWYRSSDVTIDLSDTPLGDAVAVAALAAGATSSALTTSVTAPATPGTLYYGACVTAISGEATAANNCHSVAITVTATPEPDLTVADPTASSSTVTRGDPFTLTTTVTNSGSAAAAATNLQWYSSPDTTIGTDDIALGSPVTVAALAAGASSNSLSSSAITAPAAPGMYHYGACVVAVTDEANTENNCSASVTVTVPPIYTCSNGTAKTDTPAANADIEGCSSCETGYKLGGSGGDDCVATVYTCTDGTAKTGSPAGNADVGLCASCISGFKLAAPNNGTIGDDGTTCVATQYTCTDGTGKDGSPTGNNDVGACQRCNPGFKLSGTAGENNTTCVATQYTCPATGTAKTGTPTGNADVLACQSCSSGFKLTGDAGADNTTCVATQYTCTDGMPADGKPNTNADAEKCKSCNVGFTLNTTSNQCTDNPPTFSAGPTFDRSTDTSATVKLTASEAGKLFWVLYTDNAPAPANAAALIAAASGGNAGVKQSGDSETVTPDEKTVTIGGLTANTPYDFYAVLQDSAGNSSTVSRKLDIATATGYTCINGMPKAGSPGGSDNVALCASCNSGFKLAAPSGGSIGDDGTTCVATVYTCSNGTPADGKPTGTADVAQCKSCKSGYALNSNTLCAYSSKDFNTLNAAGNNIPVGIWSDDTTMWVADDGEDKIYAYNLATKARESTKEIALAEDNTDPYGIWSDGTTMWVADWDDNKIYAYNLATKARDPDKDFDTLTAAGNTGPQGIWSDDTTMWVADDDAKIYAYTLATKARDATNDFDTLQAAGNTRPAGIWSDDTTMWVVDIGKDKLYAYNLATKARDSAQDITLAAGNTDPYGIWADDTTMWVADFSDDKIYAYTLATKARDTRDTAQDFNTLTAAGNTGSQGIWSDSTTVWVVDIGKDKLYAYNLATKARDPDKDFDTLSAAGNTDPRGIWSDGTTVWVADDGDNKLYAYDMSSKARDTGKDFDTLQAAGNTDPAGIWSDGTTMWVADDGDNKLYAYDMSSKARDTGKDFDTLKAAGNTDPRGIWSDGTTMWVADYDDSKLYAYTMSSKARDTGKDFNTLTAAGNTLPTGIWSDGATMWVVDWFDEKIYAYPVP